MDIKNKKIFKGFIIYLFISIFHILNESFYYFSLYGIDQSKKTFNTINHISNFLIYFLIVFTLFCITKRFLLSNWIMTILYFLMTIASYLKNAYTATPIFLSDLSFLKSGAVNEIFELIKFTDIIHVIVKLSIYIVFFLILELSFSFIYKKYFNIKIKNIYITLISLCCSIIIFIPSIFGIFVHYKNDNFMYSPNHYVQGFFSGLYGYHLISNIEKPQNYDEENVKNIYQNYISKENIENWGNPNVIVVLNEAFWDIRKFKDLNFSIDILENYDKIKEKSKSFNIISPSYGSKTGNIEYEFCTLSSLRYYTESTIPYNTFLNTENTKNYSASIARILNDNNYITNIYSPFDNGRVYLVYKLYEYLGFQNAYYQREFVDYIKEHNLEKDYYERGGRVRNEFLIDYVFEDIKENDKPTFSFVKTVETHMPYENIYSKDEIKFEITSDLNLSESDYETLYQYSKGINESSKMINDIYEKIQLLDEPTIVIVFGDHLPPLTNYDKNYDILEKYYFSDDEFEKYQQKYITEGLIFSNYEINHSMDFDYIGFDGLSAYILKHLNIKQNSYIDYIYDSLNVLPSGNIYISTDNKGNVYKTSEINKEMKTVFDMKKQLQYYLIKEMNKK